MNSHNTFDYILNPHHKVTVAVIGCGGTGSQVLSILASMNKALMALGHIGLHVTAYDPDQISIANVGRQLYSESEIGCYKSVSLITRLNRFFGTNWKAVPEKFKDEAAYNVDDTHNIYISCVDDFQTRLDIGMIIKNKEAGHHSAEQFYWLDFGNTNKTGQAILGTLQYSNKHNPMACFDEWAAKYNPPAPSENTPSCSLAEALDKQDLMINRSLATSGMQLLWRLFREGRTPYRGVIINLDTLTSNPILV